MENSKLIHYLSENRQSELYLDYVNNFVTVKRFAEHYGLSIDGANLVINQGRELQKPIELQITKREFLSYYFESGLKKERDSIKDCLMDELINSLVIKDTFSINTVEIFDGYDHGNIQLSYCVDSFDIDNSLLLADIGRPFTLELID